MLSGSPISSAPISSIRQVIVASGGGSAIELASTIVCISFLLDELKNGRGVFASLDGESALSGNSSLAISGNAGITNGSAFDTVLKLNRLINSDLGSTSDIQTNIAIARAVLALIDSESLVSSELRNLRSVLSTIYAIASLSGSSSNTINTACTLFVSAYLDTNIKLSRNILSTLEAYGLLVGESRVGISHQSELSANSDVGVEVDVLRNVLSSVSSEAEMSQAMLLARSILAYVNSQSNIFASLTVAEFAGIVLQAVINARSNIEAIAVLNRLINTSLGSGSSISNADLKLLRTLFNSIDAETTLLSQARNSIGNVADINNSSSFGVDIDILKNVLGSIGNTSILDVDIGILRGLLSDINALSSVYASLSIETLTTVVLAASIVAQSNVDGVILLRRLLHSEIDADSLTDAQLRLLRNLIADIATATSLSGTLSVDGYSPTELVYFVLYLLAQKSVVLNIQNSATKTVTATTQKNKTVTAKTSMGASLSLSRDKTISLER